MSAFAALMKPVGPKAESFVFDRRMVTGIMGPVGSAKTTSCIRKMVLSTLWQNPGPDGVRRAKWGVIRDTYPQLKKTALASWFAWFPKSLGAWNGEAPFEHTVKLLVPGHGKIELTVLFAAMGENKVEDVMRGWELTGLWMNEGDLLAKQVFTYGMGRVGRYPNALQGGCTWRGVILDMNAPDVENWTYEVFVDQDLGLDKLDPEELEQIKAELGDLFGVGFYRQPGGRSKDPPPENLANLPRGYYAQQMIGSTADYVRRFVDSIFGATRKGQPVYPEYQDEVHCAPLDHRHQKLPPIARQPIVIATDQDLSAAAVVMQRDHRGQIRVLGEIVNFADNEETELEQLGATEFGRKVGRYVMDQFPDNPVADIAWCDPAATAGESATGADPSWRQNFQKGLNEALGREKGNYVKVKPAPVPGNRIDDRLDAVRKPMKRLVEGGEAGFRICPVRCKVLRRGFTGMYVFSRIQLRGGHGAWQDKPLKNDYANVQDAVQYGAIAISKHGNGEARGTWTGHPGEARPATTVKNVRDYDIHAGA